MIGGTKDIYRELLANLSARQGQWYDSQLTCFVGLKDEQFNARREFLVVGRAVNGWLNSDKPENWKDQEKLNGFIAEIFKDGPSGTFHDKLR